MPWCVVKGRHRASGYEANLGGNNPLVSEVTK